jgi:predicted transcriptional regulator
MTIMSQTHLPKPTDAELSILSALWKNGPSTVKQVHDLLGEKTGYTTTLKLLQIMMEKGLVVRDPSQALSSKRASSTELAQIKKLIDQLSKESK